MGTTMTARTTVTPPPGKYAHVAPLPNPPKALDAMQQLPYITRAYMILDNYFHRRPDVFVSGDGYLCYDTRDRSRWVRPDCVVAFGVDPAAIFGRNGYVISEVGKPPDFVLEVASESTGRRDYTAKRAIYAEYGVAEYWRFDRSGGQYHDRPLSGDRLTNGRYEPIPLDTGADGVIRGYSPVLELELHWDDSQLRFYDPAAGDYLPDLAEAIAQRDAAEARVAAVRSVLEAENERLRDQLRRLQSE